jgi:hypothetical protein
MGHRMRAGYSAIVCGLPTPLALPIRPLQRHQGPREGLLCVPDRKGNCLRVQLGLRHRPQLQLGLQPCLWLQLGLLLRVRLRVGP